MAAAESGSPDAFAAATAAFRAAIGVAPVGEEEEEPAPDAEGTPLMVLQYGQRTWCSCPGWEVVKMPWHW